MSSRAVVRRAAPARPWKLGTGYEFWFVTAALLLTAVLPGISKYQGDDAASTSPANEILWSFMYLVAILRLSKMRSTALPLLRRSLPLWGFVLLMCASVVWSVEPMITFKNGLELVGTTLVGLYIVTRFTLPQFMIIFALTFTMIAFLSFGFIFGAPGHGRMDWGAGAWSGIYQEKNNLAAAAALAIISQVILFARVRGRSRMVVLASIFFFGTLLIGANSATAFGDCVAVLAVPLSIYAWRSPNFGGFARVAIVAGGAIAALVVSIVGFSPDTLFSLVGRKSNLTGRADFWPYLQQAISDHPWLGYGYNAFFRSSVGSDYLSSYIVQAGGWTPYHAHNSFLQMRLDAGDLGFGALIILLVISLVNGVRFIVRDRDPLAVWPLAIVLYLLLGSFTETYFANCNTVEWILFTAAMLYPIRETLRRRVATAPVPRRRSPAVVRDHTLREPGEVLPIH